MKSKIATDADIRNAIAERFSGHGGGARLARALGITDGTASVLRGGGGSLVKAAAYFGYVRDLETLGRWILSSTKVQPRDVGYRIWTPDIVADIRRRLKSGDSLLEIAKAFGMSRKRLREKAARHGLLTGNHDLHYELGAAACRLRGDEYGERRIRAEQEARSHGGTFEQQLAHMQHLLMSDEDRRRFYDEIRELLDAA